MNYLEQPLAAFLDSVASGEPAPAGGAVAAEIAGRLAREGNPNLRGDAVAAALLAEAVLVEINTAAGEVADDRFGRVGEFVTRAAGAARGLVESDG